MRMLTEFTYAVFLNYFSTSFILIMALCICYLGDITCFFIGHIGHCIIEGVSIETYQWEGIHTYVSTCTTGLLSSITHGNGNHIRMHTGDGKNGKSQFFSGRFYNDHRFW